jgi:hypothetical protein
MSNNDLIRKLLEDAQQVALEDAEQGTPLAFGSHRPGEFEMEMTDFELNEAIGEAAKITDANHPHAIPRSRRIRKNVAGSAVKTPGSKRFSHRTE